MKSWLYNLQVGFARRFLPKFSSPASIILTLHPFRSVEVALCGRTPYYDELVKALKEAQEYWGLSDASLRPFELRFVPRWFHVITSHNPWQDRICMGVVAMDVREIRVAFRGDLNEEDQWDRTLAHELGHIYCHEHPELGVAWDPEHKAKEVWGKADAYHARPKIKATPVESRHEDTDQHRNQR